MEGPATALPALGWRIEHRPLAGLPPLSWLARLRDGTIGLTAGASVRVEPNGFFEGSWAGPADMAAIPAATTVFGSGIVVDGTRAVVITASNTLEPVYLVRLDAELVLANSLAALLEGCALELDPGVLYPPIFGRINRGLAEAAIELPTSGPPITQLYCHNLVVTGDGTSTVMPKQVEPPFTSFADYRDRLVERMRSLFANAPEYEPIVALSSGYDSTAVAAVGAVAGLRRAATIRDGIAWRGYGGTNDNGAPAARALGLEVFEFERLAYLAADDMPEAEFLAGGMSGEDVILRSLEPVLRRSILLTGFWGGALWRGHDRSDLRRTDLSGASLTDFRLRTDFIHLPVPYIGGIQQPSVLALRNSPEMGAWSVGGEYDEPIARRLAEEAGVPRGSFGTTKLAVSRRFHIEGLAALSPAGRTSLEQFAGPAALAQLPRRRPIGRRHRLAIRLAHALRVPRLAAGLEERRRQAVHFEPVLGSLLLRWALTVVRPRYRALRAPPEADRSASSSAKAAASVE